MTKFSFYCADWDSKNRPLRYQVFYKIGNNESILWYSGRKSMSAWNVLPIGDTLDGNKVTIRFRIVNIYEGYAEPKDVFVHVSDFLVLKHIAK